jgi:hypothetical protein
MLRETAEKAPGALRLFDKPLTAEIFIALVWVLFVSSIVDFKMHTDPWTTSALASVSLWAR